ncbi:MAG: hypothetical protein ACRCY9_13125 [Phycicoccus sp.]
MTATHHLIGLGMLDWEQIRDLCAASTCAWADYDGFHIEPADQLPQEAPPYTHLWAWSPRHLIRVRLDGPGGVVGVLIPNTDGPDAHAEMEPATWPHPQISELATVVEHTVTNFKEDSGTTRLVQVVGPMPITFVAGP